MSEKIATREAYGKALVELGASNDKIVVLDAVFSLDSVITAVGMVDHLAVMMAAVIIPAEMTPVAIPGLMTAETQIQEQVQKRSNQETE